MKKMENNCRNSAECPEGQLLEKNFDNKDLKKSKVEDIKLLSESEFKTSFNKYKKTKEDEIVKYVDE